MNDSSQLQRNTILLLTNIILVRKRSIPHNNLFASVIVILKIIYISDTDTEDPVIKRPKLQSGSGSTSGQINAGTLPLHQGPETSCSSSGTSSKLDSKTLVQWGSGDFPNQLHDHLVSSITNAVSAKLEAKYPVFRPTTTNWPYYETVKPTVTSEVMPENTKVPLCFGVSLNQNDLNDTFDCDRLMKLVPAAQKEKAKVLLNIFETHPNDVTFDAKGTVYINSTSIPNSNIFVLFPALFKKRGKSAQGLSELLVKLEQMNLLHLISRSKLHTPKVTHSLTNQPMQKNWWYLK